ncbi:hypothetical protein PAECIP111893_02590 [Paenibacillus plantiphilus]|uniref:SLH domain-containing protein n=1 Tax=Paenibacillus plantiphilus TaxID=2905650 RepID=A0ABM9CAG9_9BACL|nr:hypothetical protein PAECIP111893_02590 [Paenibacillus plantiphilus]
MVDATITEVDKLESPTKAATATSDVSTAPTDVTANATTDTVVVGDVPAGATVTIYDDNGTEIGTATNNGGSTGDVTVTIPGGLTDGQVVDATITEVDKLESPTKDATATSDVSTAPTDVTANATTDTVVVGDVPAGATVTIYDDNGTEIGTANNNGGSTGDVTVTIPGGLTDGQVVDATITEVDKLESPTKAATATSDVSTAPTDVTANATTDTVVVGDVPAGATVTIYDDNGTEIGTATNNGGSTGDVTVTIPGGLTDGQVVDAKITEQGKLESPAKDATATTDQSAAPEDVVADPNTDEVIVKDVPPGATVTVYDDKGDVIGTATNNGGSTAVVTVPINDGLESNQVVQVTITEVAKQESTKTSATAGLSDEQAVEKAAQEVQIIYSEGDTWESVTSSIFMLTVGPHETNVHWTSSKPSVITITDPVNNKITADVNRQAQEQSVIITAKIFKNGYEKTRTFLLIVKANGVTKTVNEQYVRNIAVEGQTGVTESLPIIRIDVVNPNGSTSIIDKVIMTQTTTQSLIDNSAPGDKHLVIDMDEAAGDAPDEFAVEVTTGSVSQLANNGFDLDVQTDYATLAFTPAVIQQLGSNKMDLFIRIVPIKQPAKQQQVKDRLPKTLENKTVSVVGTPLEIETNYRGYSTALFIPFAKNGIDLNNVALDRLRVYIEHSDGEIAIEKGTVVRDASGTPIGLSLNINKFSTFTIIELKDVVTPGGPIIITGETLPVDIETGANGKGTVIEKTDVKRQPAGDGTKKDELTLTSQKAADTVQKVAAAGQSNARIVVPDVKDEVSEVLLNVEKSAIEKLADAKVALELKTINGLLGIPVSSFGTPSGNTTIKLTPVKDAQKQQELLNNAIQSKELEKDVKPKLVGRPLTVETNLTDKTSTLTLPIPAALIPTDTKEREAFFASLLVYGEFGQGDSWLKAGKVVELGNGSYGVEIGASKNGTFAIVEWPAHKAHYKYVNGYPDKTFKPERSITRAEIAAILARNLPAELLGGLANINYTDVASKHWAANYIKVATEAGLMKGYPDGSFKPDALITRAELALISATYKELTTDITFKASTYYPDIKKHWAAGAIDSLNQTGIMKGYPDGTFLPQKMLTRAEAVTTINRLFERGPLFGVEKSSWPDVALTHWAFKEIEEASNNHEYSPRAEGGEELIRFFTTDSSS